MASRPQAWSGRAGLLVLLAVVCPAVLAAPGAQDPGIFTGRYLLQVAASLVFVLACLVGLLHLLRRMNGVAVTNRKGIQVLASVKVGTREKILLLEAGDNQLLVGVAAGSVRTLHVFDQGSAFDDVLAQVKPGAQA
ncbi:MAG: flagellar biosynthetic protein FliO [Halioglobus sp.]|nr:flagellar biosynthetic protein FliO [Halioglobus sp.]